jgi:hypothetical protein
MLNVEFGTGVLGMMASGRHSHKGHGKKTKICRSVPAASFSLVFVTRAAGHTKKMIKFKRGQSVAWLNYGAKLCSVTCKLLWLELFFCPTPSLLH